MSRQLVALAACAVVAAVGARAAAAQAEPVKREPVATGLAIGATAVSGVLVYASLRGESVVPVIGATLLAAAAPSAGHIYAGETKHAIGMSLGRLVGLGALGLGFGLAAHDCEIDCWSLENNDAKTIALIGVGALTYLATTAYDLYDAHRAAERANTSERAGTTAGPSASVRSDRSDRSDCSVRRDRSVRRGRDTSVQPVVLANDRGHVVGISIGGRF